MATESLADGVKTLTPPEQEAVLRFIEFLKRQDASVQPRAPFLQAIDEFIAQHPDLLQWFAR